MVFLSYSFIFSRLLVLLLLHFLNTSGLHGQKGSFGIISGGGYLGSRLVDYLSFDQGYSVVAFDRNPRNTSRLAVKLSAEDIPSIVLQSFDTIVYLGGLAGRSPCNKQPNVTFKENVEDITNLALRMKYNQLLLFASTSSLLTGWGASRVAEDAPLHTKEFDRYEASMAMREINLRILSNENPSTFPQIIGMRLGTVIGVSPSQRTNYLHIGLVCSAFINGFMTVSHPETFRSALWLEDFVRVVERLHEKSSSLKRFDIFHLQSHWGTVGNIANTVALATHTQVRIKEHAPAPDSIGFSLDSRRLETAIDFNFKGTLDTVITHLLDNVSSLCVGRDLMSPSRNKSSNELSRCVVCGSTDMISVLDLTKQPLTGDFFGTKEKALACDTHPLAISRCKVCHHSQLTHFANHSRLFRDYTHSSSQNTASKDYLLWLSAKIVSVQAGRNLESKNLRGGSVLVLACTDGKQLDEFKKNGWKAYCVGPSEIFAALSRAEGQNASVNVWGEEKSEWLPLDFLDAIVGQNVLDHVLDPLAFLKACTTAMGSYTRLYLQTSCEMFESGQFDSAYHEHLSFFSAHSLFKLAHLANLTITEFLKTKINGVSCLVTFMRSSSDGTNEQSLTLQAEMSREVSVGITSDFFYIRYSGLVHAMQKWINARLSDLYQQGFEVAGLGATAKGMVLMNYLLNMPGRKWELSFLVDETPLYQGTFCPGTTIPVLPLSYLTTRDPRKPLVMVFFSWNFAEEFLKKAVDELRSTPVITVLAIIPFPQQRLISIHVPTSIWSVVLENPAKFPIWPVQSPSSKSTLTTFAILTFQNDATFIAHWIRHHAPIFDHVLMINLGSTDGSEAIAALEAPGHWTFQSTTYAAAQSNAQKNSSWSISLTPKEFLVHSTLRTVLDKLDDKIDVFCFASFALTERESPPMKQYTPILLQRTRYSVEKYVMNDPQTLPLRNGFGPSRRIFRRGSPPVNENISTFPDSCTFNNDNGAFQDWASSGFIAVLGEEKQSKDLVEVDFRTVFSSPKIIEQQGVTQAMLRAHTNWHEMFGNDISLHYEVEVVF